MRDRSGIRRAGVARRARSYTLAGAITGAVLLALLPPLAARADDGLLVALFDLDRDPTTGCSATTAEGVVGGVELRLTTTIDLVTLDVTAVTRADCIDPPTSTFGAEVPVTGAPVAPWSVVTGEGTSGSALIETWLPLSAIPVQGVVDVVFSLVTPAGSDALATADGAPGGKRIHLVAGPFGVPLLSTGGSVVLMLLLGVAAIAATRKQRTILLSAVLGVAIVASPVLVRAALGDGSLRQWSGAERIATDTAGDAPIGADLLSAFAVADPMQDALFLRVDALLGPAVCLAWSTVDPGSGYSCSQEPPPDPGPFANQIALTFDDGPNPATTPSILATLRAENVPATFFMLGSQLQTPEARALALEIHEDPLFNVANHSYSHPFFTGLTPAQAHDEIVSASEAIRTALEDPCYFPRFFRFPYSATNCAVIEVAREQGFSIVGFHVDSLDWCYALGSGYCDASNVPGIPDELRGDMLGWILFRMQERQGGVLLMHDIHPNTVAQLPGVIAGLKSAGVTFVRLDDAAIFPLISAAVNPPEPPACCDGSIH